MARVSETAPISVCIDTNGERPSIQVRGRADRSGMSKVVDLLDKLAAEDKRCVSLDLLELESIDHAALEVLAESADGLRARSRRLHLHSASQAVWDTLQRLQLTELFCSHSECNHPCTPEGCGHATRTWEMDVFSFPSLLVHSREARERVDRVAEAVGFSKCRRGDIALAVGEAITNAIKYGSTGEDPQFTVSCIATADKLCVSISDSGPGFSLENLPSFEDALFMEHGRGVHCMNAVMDEVTYDFHAGTTVRMVKLSA